MTIGRPDLYYRETVCLVGKGENTCRYLAIDLSGFSCVKRHPDARAVLDFRVAKGTMTARGDNCDGIADEDRAA